MGSILTRIRRELEAGSALDALTTGLAPSDLASLLMEVARARAAARRPPDLMRQWREDRFVRPSRADPRLLARIDLAALDAAEGYEAIELSPLAPLGVCSAIATVAQHKIVSAARQVEVLSDPSNVLALECAARRTRDRAAWARLATNARAVRAQALARPEHSAHFRLFVMVVAGDGPDFERIATGELVRAQLRLLAELASRGHPTRELAVTLSPDARQREAIEELAASLRRERPDVAIAVGGERIAKSGYYQRIAFGVHVGAERIPLGDGGCTDWVAKLTSDRKQKTMIGAIGTELLATILAPTGALAPGR